MREAVESSARAAAGSFAYSPGDRSRARREYQTIVAKWSSSSHEAFRQRAEAAARTLERLPLD